MNLRIQEHRKRAGYSSARAFAEDHGYNVKTYTNWEQSAAMPPLEKAWELADIFGCAIDDLVGREQPSSGISISEDERRILDDYRACTPERKREASQYLRERRAFSEEHAGTSVSYDKAVNE